jgi:CelD/BcsL family acetyltransferase involved in cellulose biosynthesis
MSALFPNKYAGLDRSDSLMNRLAGRYAVEDPLCSRSEWVFSFHEQMGRGRELLFRETADSLIAFAFWEHPAVGPILEPLEYHWRFTNPLLGPDAVELLRALLAENDGDLGDCLVLLSGLEAGVEHHRAVLEPLAKTHEIHRMDQNLFCSASLEGGEDGFLSRRSPKFRQNLRRSLRMADERGVRFERVIPEGGGAAEQTYERMVAIERQSWKGLDRVGMDEEPSLGFYRRMFRRLSLGGLARGLFAVADGRDIGFVLGGVDGANFRGQQFSFVADWGRESIGNLLQWETIQWLCSEGIRRYDMGSVIEYKLRWTELRLRTESVMLVPKSRGR